MGASLKFDYPPLLAPGRHYRTLTGVHDLCVAPFGARQSREQLFSSLEELVQQFLRAKVPCEMWIDGSFVTEKPDPDDVDVLVLLDYEVANNLDTDQRRLVDAANQPAYIQGVDSFVDTLYPRDHELFDPWEDGYTWAEQYGLENSDVWLKGFVVLRLRETSVGLRIRR